VQLGNEKLGGVSDVFALPAELPANRDTSPPGTTLSKSGRRITLALLASVFAVHFLDRQLLAILIPPIKVELGLSDTALGFLSGFAFTVFFSTVGLLIARIADRADRARVITWSLVAFSVMTALCGLATSFWQLLAARIGVGAGEGGTNPASHSLIADAFPLQHRATAMAVYSVGPNLGLILAFGIGGWLAQTLGWRVAFFIAGLLGLAIAIATRTSLHDPRNSMRVGTRVEGPSAVEVSRAILRSPTLRHLFAAATLATAAATGLVTWLPALLTRIHALTLAQTGVFLALTLGVVGAAGTYACGRIADRASVSDPRHKLFVLAMLQSLLAVSLPLALLAEPRISAAVLLVLPCAIIAGYIGPTLALVQGIVDPRARAFSAAILLFFVNLVGAGIGPFAVGAISDALAASAGPQSLRYAMLLTPLLCIWSAWHYWLAAPTLVGELRE
jgi:predicted MFS family arabinose efflux permease